MTRLKQARIAFYVVFFAYVVLIAVSWPHPARLAGVGSLIVCGGAVLLSYREHPAAFHRRVGRWQALGLLLTPVIGLCVVILLGTHHLL